MQTLKTINFIISVVFFVCYAYQFLYIPAVLWLRRRRAALPAAPASNHYAILICARNEAAVIGDLLASLRAQTYPRELLTVYVLADNCTDDTARIAREGGAVVYERFNRQLVGKGYALQTLLTHIARDVPAGYDGYFVFDADNLLSPDYIEQMNRTFSAGHDIITSYRASKNYGDNWISAGYALWFLRESRYLNHARSLLGTSCAVSGTGFLFSRAVLEETGPWPFHLLTEDIEFSIHEILQGRKIAFCPDAVLYDEQPTTFRQSWRQRLRWSKGYLQVFQRYGTRLLGGVLRGNFSCFDMSMAIMPAFVLSTVSIASNLALAVWGVWTGGSILIALQSLGQMLLSMYLTLFVIGAITTVTERRHIHTGRARRVLYAFTFPLFMFTYGRLRCGKLSLQLQHFGHRCRLCRCRDWDGTKFLDRLCPRRFCIFLFCPCRSICFRGSYGASWYWGGSFLPCAWLQPHSGTQGKTGGDCRGNDDSLFHFGSSSLDVK